MHEIRTDIEIDAPAERVWAELTAFDRYHEWNPTMRIGGRANMGAHLLVDLRMPGLTARQFRPTVVGVTRGPDVWELRWLGHLFVEGLFDGEHTLRVETIDESRSRVVHAERFEGLLAGLVVGRFGSRVQAGFEAMNTALKTRVESGAEADETPRHVRRTAGRDSGVGVASTDGDASDATETSA
jgi:hypothetical protein